MLSVRYFFITIAYCFVVVTTSPLPLDEGTARTAIQVHAVYLIENRLRGKMAAHFEPVMSDW